MTFFYVEDDDFEGDNSHIVGVARYEIFKYREDNSHPDDPMSSESVSASARLVDVKLDGWTLSAEQVRLIAGSHVDDKEVSAAQKWLDEN